MQTSIEDPYSHMLYKDLQINKRVVQQQTSLEQKHL